MNALIRIRQSATAPDFVANPYPFYDRIRALGDFVFWEDYAMPVATSYEAVKAVLADPAVGRELPMSKRQKPDHLVTHHKLDHVSLLRMDAPEHTRLRNAATQVLSDESILALSQAISQTCDALINAFPRNAPFDLQKEFADKVPGITIMRFLGLPEEMHAQMRIWVRDFNGLMLARRDRTLEEIAEDAAVALRTFLNVQIDQKRRQGPSDDFISHMLSDNKTLSDDELISLIVLIVQGAIYGIGYALGNALLQLSRYPDMQCALPPDQIESTVAECLRFEPSTQVVGRHAQEDVTILGQEFRRGTMIGCLLGSACHDDAVWPDGNVFDPFRAERTHLAFGSGLHTCIGTSFVRTIMKIALPALFSRCTSLRIKDTPVYANDFPFRGLKTLIVEL